ncbi:MAG: hypothetical protein AB7O66_06245 [Limisphaerales bacterium]
MMLSPMLAMLMPTFEQLVIAFFGACLPTGFFFWMSWWLGSVKDENPDKIIAEQAKADEEHAKHHGHGHGHGGGHHAAHA